MNARIKNFDLLTASKSSPFLSKILDFIDGKRFFSFANADGKRWVMPVRNMQTAMNLYQPSGVKGKAVKWLFPWLHWLPAVRRAMKAEALRCTLRKDLYALLCKAFGVEALEFSVFGGTPSVHQKVTIQLSLGARILGYCKVTESPEIFELFQSEEKMLQQLRDCGMENIPRCLWCGKLADGLCVFVQSTVKTRRSVVVHRWSALQEGFLNELHEQTRRVLPFEETDYAQTLADLRLHLDWLPDNVERQAVLSAVEAAEQRFQGRAVEFSACHADFTPWNMFVEQGKLFVFDFEYARMTYPPGLDRYHFFLQTAIFERRWDAGEIMTHLRSADCAWFKRDDMVLYLLDVMSRFMMREGGKVEGDAAQPFALWGTLLKHFCGTA